ncbi:MAG: DUF302 domain-containing protein [Coxiellaceae bacterium]|nr:MAG: DUF302 domain-containing protein [Coxiellaceae bacterium]
MLITKTSPLSVALTVKTISATLQQAGITVFATIDHAKNARDVGLELRDAVLLIFGNPKVGTLLMQEQPIMGIDLPMRMLIWQDENQETKITYLDPVKLAEQYNLKQNQELLQKYKE